MNETHTEFSDGLNPDVVIPLVVPAVTFGSIITIVAVVLYFRYRSQQLRHELYRSFIDKGEPIPPALLSGSAQPKPKSRHGDLRLGLFLLTGGIGLSLSLLLARQFDGAPFGLIPALIGAGFLVVWKVEARSRAESASY